MSDSSLQPLTAAARGFVELAGWLGELAGAHLVDVARAVDEGRLDGTAALARSAALPLIGWVALVNEVLDAATVITLPPQRLRERTSDDHIGPQAWEGQNLVARDLVNGFGEPLDPRVHVNVEAETTEDHLVFRLRATGIPHECVGVYSGTVGPQEAESTVPVWLVIP
jgi:hypothetical protein